MLLLQQRNSFSWYQDRNGYLTNISCTVATIILKFLTIFIKFLQSCTNILNILCLVQMAIYILYKVATLAICMHIYRFLGELDKYGANFIANGDRTVQEICCGIPAQLPHHLEQYLLLLTAITIATCISTYLYNIYTLWPSIILFFWNTRPAVYTVQLII